jgi:hypothetical protein
MSLSPSPLCASTDSDGPSPLEVALAFLFLRVHSRAALEKAASVGVSVFRPEKDIHFLNQ